MTSCLDLSLYLVLDPVQCGGHQASLDVARAALEGGATVVQLRAPEWHKRAWLALALDLLPLTRAARVPLIIDDHLDIALAAGADGVHVGQRDLPADVARKLLGPDALIGLSVSRISEVDDANPLGDIVDYLGAGPVFDTPTKPDASAACGIDGLAALCAALSSSDRGDRRHPVAQRRRCQTRGTGRDRGGFRHLHRRRPAPRRATIAGLLLKTS